MFELFLGPAWLRLLLGKLQILNFQGPLTAPEVLGELLSIGWDVVDKLNVGGL